jgi:cytoskeletal protein RodZ
MEVLIPMSNQMRREPNSNRNLSDEVSYQQGYQTGKDSERLLQQEAYAAREENSAASGLMIGFALVTLAALAGGTIYFLNARNEPAQQTAPSTQVAPVPNNSQSPSSNKQTTIIERTIEKTQKAVPVPQQPTKAPEAPAPNINIQLPTPQQQRTESETSPSSVQPQTNQAEPKQKGTKNETSPSLVQPQTNESEPNSSNSNQ